MVLGLRLARQDRLPVCRWCEREPREGQWCWDEDWRDKIVYLCADGASVNLGKDNGVGMKIGATRSSTCVQMVQV